MNCRNDKRMKTPRKDRLVEELREAIRNSGLDVTELGVKAGVSHTVVGRFVRAERGVTIAVASRLCAALGLELVKRKKGKAKA
jgi:ribosome-binding protein aMBF1 (putative translation factor)